MSEQEFIPAGEKSQSEKRENMSRSEQAMHDFAKGMEDHFDNVNAGNEYATAKVREEYVKPVDINQLASQFDSIIEQSSKLSNTIAETIQIKELGEESAKMLDEAITGLSKLHTQKSLPEKLAGYLPDTLGIRSKVESALDIAELQVKRNQTVKEFATSHFKALEEKQRFVDENRIAIDKINAKLGDSSTILLEMMEQAKGSIEYMKREQIHDKSSEIKSKQLIARVGAQLITQKELVEQTEIYESIASVVSENINATLPQIQNQFIDQVSVSSSLRNLKDLQDSVRGTQNLMLDLKDQSFKEMGQILDIVEKEGLGETDKQREKRDSHRKQMDALCEKRNRIERNFSEQLDRDIEKNMQALERHERNK